MAECQRCPFQQIVTALSDIVKTFPNRSYRKGCGQPRRFSQAEYLAYSLKPTKVNRKVRDAAAALIEPYAKLAAFVEEKILPSARQVCLACAGISDDDNLSRHGRVFVSLDAMPTGVNLAGGGRQPSPNDGGDDPQSPDDPACCAQGDFVERENDAFFADSGDDDPAAPSRSGDWLNTHALRPEENHASSSNLPAHIEDAILSVLHDFLQLSVFEQNMLIQYLSSGSFTFVDFAQMGWVPHEMHRPQSKEFIHARWKNLCGRFPLAAALKSGTLARGRLSPKKSAARGRDGRAPMFQDELPLSSFS